MERKEPVATAFEERSSELYQKDCRGVRSGQKGVVNIENRVRHSMCREDQSELEQV